MNLQQMSLRVAGVFLCAVAWASGCDGADDGAAPSGHEASDDPEPAAPVYAVASTVFDDSGTTTYLNLFNSLDAPVINDADAREYPGWATIAAKGGKLFVASGEAPEITRYTLGPDAALRSDGTLSFASYGLTTAAFYTNVFVDEVTAYMNLDHIERVVWNPADLDILGTGEVLEVQPTRDGLRVFAAYDRGVAVRDDDILHPYYWTDENFFAYHERSQVSVYDRVDGRLHTVLDVPCPALDTVTVDEDGNHYFSIWPGTIAYRLMHEDAPKSCVARVKAGERAVDASWTRRFEELTGGHETGQFRYLADGIGIVAAFDDARIAIGPDTEPGEITGSANWQLWRVDLEAWTAEPIEELGWFAGGYYAFTIDGRTFVLLPSADYATTTAYELFVDGTVAKRFETRGWAYQLVRVR